MTNNKVVIVGAGFGGLNIATRLKNCNLDVLVIDKANHHLFQPLLYQVATAALSAGNIAVPIRAELRNNAQALVYMAEVTNIDLPNKKVFTSNGNAYTYDWLVLAPGAHHSYFGHDEWELFAPGLKTVADALRIRERILLAFEKAERCENYSEIARYLRFVIVGSGPTGVEMAGAISEIAYKTMFRNFRNIHPEQSEIFLIEAGPKVLPAFSPDLSEKAHKDLEKMGVKVLLNTKVTDVTHDGVYCGEHYIPTANVIWAAGNKAPALLATLDVPRDNAGRVIVQPDLSIPGYPQVFVIGDASHSKDANNTPLPGIAPVAIQQAKYLVNVIKKQLPQSKRRPFKYWDKGTMATIGKAKAVAMVGKAHFSGFFAWLMWSLIHVAYLVSFRNRLIVMMQWFFLFASGNRNERLIIRPAHDFPDREIIEEIDIKPAILPQDFPLPKNSQKPSLE